MDVLGRPTTQADLGQTAEVNVTPIMCARRTGGRGAPRMLEANKQLVWRWFDEVWNRGWREANAQRP